MEGVKETSSSVHPTAKIVPKLQNNDHQCSVCGSAEKKLIDLEDYGLTPVQIEVFKNLIMEWTLEVSGDGGRGGSIQDDEFEWSCEGCMTRFEWLASVKIQITDLENRAKQIERQLKKTIGDRLGIISHSNLRGREPEASSLVLDVDEDLSIPTHMMADESSDEEVDLDLKPIILEEVFLVDEVENENPLQLDGDDDDGLCNDTVGGVDLISQEEETNHSDQGGTMEEGEDQPSPKKSRGCKARATQVISAILQNDDEINDDDDNYEYSPTIESDTDSDEQNEGELGLHIGKQRDDRIGGGMSSNPSTSVQIEDDSHIGAIYAKQVVKLSRHLEIHRSDGQTFSCETCHKTFSAKKHLRVHKKRVHLKQLRHKCQKCGKRFYDLHDLKRHLKTRIPCTELFKNKKFLCPICKNGFSTKSHLRDHTRQIHNKETRFKCPHTKCGCRFYDETKLELHLKINHTQKDISCTICNQKFSSVREKLAHVKSDHTCEFCKKSFQNKGDLDEHRKTHTGDRPYTCTECGNTFGRKKGLDHHLRTTPCNPDKDEMEKARKVMYNGYKRWVEKRKAAQPVAVPVLTKPLS